MNRIKLVRLKIDNIEILFKGGKNYIIGNSNTGKTTIYNCMRFALGLTKDLKNSYISRVELSIEVKNKIIVFTRESDSTKLLVFLNGESEKYGALSSELNQLFNYLLEPNFLYDSFSESSLKILDFCFLPEAAQFNRKTNWDAVRLICGINISMLSSVEKDIVTLRSEVLKNKDIESAINTFSNKLIGDSTNRDNCNLESTINNLKQAFFEEHRTKEDLLFNVSMKLEDTKIKLEKELRIKLSEIEYSYLKLMDRTKINDSEFSTLEKLILERKTSQGIERISKLILSLAIAQASSNNQNYNHPMILINDSTNGMFHPSYDQKIQSVINDVTSRTPDLQYIEFSYNENLSQEDIIINLNKEGL